MTVSLCVIAFNEQKSLPKLFEDIINQDYNHSEIEIVLVDNLSTDNTRKIMEDFKKNNTSFKNVKIATCEIHMQAACWNVAIENSTHELIIRLDAHASIEKNFTRLNVETIKSGEFVCGGSRPNRVEEDTPLQNTLLTVEEFLFGNFAVYRKKQDKKQYVDTLFHACYKREVFAKVGGFNEALGRTEDNEMHYRIRKNGYKICLNPQIVSYQNVRPSIIKMAKQKYSNGLWIGLTLGVEPKCLSYLYFAPLILVLGYIFTSLLSIFDFSILLSILSVLYTLFVISLTVMSCKCKGVNSYTVTLPFLFILMHFSYGIGTLVGLVKMPLWRKTINNLVSKRIEDIKNSCKIN